MADEQVERYIEEENIHNVLIRVSDVGLDESQKEQISSLPNVRGFEPKVVHYLKMYIGERRNWALFIGIEDFREQTVDKVGLLSGTYPEGFRVLSDQMNDVNGVYSGKEGDMFTVIDHRGDNRTLEISGIGKSMLSLGETMEGVAVFYSPISTLRTVSNISGFNSLSFKMEKTDEASLDATIEGIRGYLTNNTNVVAFGELPNVRPEGYYEGSEALDLYQTLLSIITFLILFCSIFLISNTMNTMISEQKKEIAQMKAIGGTKPQVFLSYLLTSVIIGSIGSIAGSILGVLTAFMVLVQIGKPFGFHPIFSIHAPTVALSLAVGLVVVVLASLPALVRSSRISILDGLGGHGITARAGPKVVERLLRGLKWVPRTVQMGIRNANRRMGRSTATIVQICLAVAVLLAMLSVGSSVYKTVEGNWKDQKWDLKVSIHPSSGETLVLERGLDLFKEIPGIDGLEPFLNSYGAIEGNVAEIYGMVQNTTSLFYGRTLLEEGKGRWWTLDEETKAESVMVIGFALARSAGVGIDETVELMTATGAHPFRIIGIDRTSWDDGINIKMPITALQTILKSEGAISGFYVRTSDKDHTDVDGTAEAIYDTIEKKGYTVNIDVHYVKEEEDRSANAQLLNLFLAVSIIVVMISLIGLMSTLTMNVLDRTKEIGMLRCIGARSFEVQVVFGSEGLFLSLIGWMVGVPTGYGLYALLMAVIEDQMSLSLPWSFPASFVTISFFVTLLGTFMIILPPLVRAIRFKPGEALRYE